MPSRNNGLDPESVDGYREREKGNCDVGDTSRLWRENSITYLSYVPKKKANSISRRKSVYFLN